jgi:hypothetical protein
VWECVEVAGETHAAASCHEVAARGATLTASASHCPLTSEETALWTAKGYEPQRLRPVTAAERHDTLSAMFTLAAAFRRIGPRAGNYSRGAVFHSNSILRI